MPKKKTKKPKAPKGSALQEKEEMVEIPQYSDEEKSYLSNLQKRLQSAQQTRDQSHPEFDGMTYSQYIQANEQGANTMLKPRKNRADVTFQSGTLRTKMMAFLASFQGLNLQGDISAFNEHDIPINALGNAMEDIIEKTEEIENDEEQKMLREYELLKHGHVFVEDLWEQRWIVEKKITKGFYGNKTGVTWESKTNKAPGQPRRKIISGLSVYLGNIRQYFITKQPYIFTVETIDWNDAKQIYGGWEMWKYVSKKKKKFSGNVGDEMAGNAWRLFSDTQEEEVEKIIYQDKPNNEFQIILNGVPMLPMGYPLTAINADGEYTIIQQNLEPIRYNFAYGKSFIFKHKNQIAVLDEMLKLAVLKTQKSFLPPYLNLANRVISRSVFMPGKITRGIKPGDIRPVSDKEAQGVTSSELAMIQEVTRIVDRNTVSQTFTGAREPGGKVTATQIIELQRQARIMMGLLTLAAALLEKKLTNKRLMILLEKWFDPIDETFDRARRILKNRYRTVSRVRNIEGKGPGIRMIIPSERIPTSDEIRTVEEKWEKRTKRPLRIIMINPKELKHAMLTWVTTVNPKEKRSSELSKLLFRSMVQDAVALGLSVDPEYIARRFAQVWEEDPSKLFRTRRPTPAATAAAVMPPERRVATPRITPEIKVPGAGGRAMAPEVLR